MTYRKLSIHLMEDGLVPSAAPEVILRLLTQKGMFTR